MGTDFWFQFWPQFWASIAATTFLALATFAFTYFTRFRIAKFLKNIIESAKSVVVIEEQRPSDTDDPLHKD